MADYGADHAGLLFGIFSIAALVAVVVGNVFAVGHGLSKEYEGSRGPRFNFMFGKWIQEGVRIYAYRMALEPSVQAFFQGLYAGGRNGLAERIMKDAGPVLEDAANRDNKSVIALRDGIPVGALFLADYSIGKLTDPVRSESIFDPGLGCAYALSFGADPRDVLDGLDWNAFYAMGPVLIDGLEDPEFWAMELVDRALEYLRPDQYLAAVAAGDGDDALFTTMGFERRALGDGRFLYVRHGEKRHKGYRMPAKNGRAKIIINIGGKRT